MEATSRFPIEDVEVLEQIVRLSQRKDFAALRGVAAELEERLVGVYARGLLKSKRPADQREIDEKRGFYDGIDYILRRLPEAAAKELKRLHNEDSKESE